MTVIVGLLDSGRVYIGGDSQSSNHYSHNNQRGGKVFRNGDFLMGVAGSWREAQVLRWSLEAPKPQEGSLYDDQTIYKFMVGPFVDAVRATFKTAGSITVKDGLERIESGVLIGFRGHLFQLQSDLAMLMPDEPYMAVGSGEELAMGSMHTSAKVPALQRKPKQRIVKALEAAAAFAQGVGPPFTVMELVSPV